MNGHFEAALTRGLLYVRVIGLATLSNAGPVEDLVEQSLKDGCRRVVFDLDPCSGMDSTFLGVIASAALFDERGASPKVTVVNANPANRCLLETIGLTELVEAPRGAVPPPDVRLDKLASVTEERDRVRLAVDTHRKLVSLNEANREAFGRFVDTLERQLAERQSDEMSDE